MEEIKLMHIGLSVNFKEGRLRKDYKKVISDILFHYGYTIDNYSLLTNRIEMSLSGKLKDASIIEKELTELGSQIENNILIDYQPICFILMPFNKKDLDEIYNDFIKPTLVESNIRCIRSDDIFGDNIIMDDVTMLIKNSTFLIADLTYRNPNVFYELGLSHAFGKKVLLLSQSVEDIPFDLRHRRVCIYEFTPRGCNKFKKEIKEHINTILKELL